MNIIGHDSPDQSAAKQFHETPASTFDRGKYEPSEARSDVIVS